MSTLEFQYYCGVCHHIFEEEQNDLFLSHIIEVCPSCGNILSDNIQKKHLVKKQNKSLQVIFQKASAIQRLTIDIAQLDSIIHFFTVGQHVCIKGIYTQELVERLCVRAQLPHRYGGLESKVLLVDGANSSDFYQCVEFAQQYGLDVKKTLKNIISSRTFTVYQLAYLLLYELENTIKRYDVKLVVITNLLHFFTNDPYLDSEEMNAILKQIIQKLKAIQNCMVVISFSHETQYDNLFDNFFNKSILISQAYHTLSVKITDNGILRNVFLTRDVLKKIQVN